jgi:hypothetical protein
MMEPHQPRAPQRLLQLDFFRGIALMVIFVNHMPENPWFHYTPSRFGLSDAAETFVFLSGFAAALAYGRGFERSGIGLGTVRILHRCGQIYAAYLGLFFLLAALCVMGNRWLPGTDYIQRLNWSYFFDQTQEALFGLITLRYVPMYLDILPLYLVVMLWIPVVWLLSRWHKALALAASALLYLASRVYGWDLPADPTSTRVWFFNPFAWQLMFFTGFAFGAGWVRPPRGRAVGVLALLFIVASVPLGHEPTFRRFEGLLEWRLIHDTLVDKAHLGILRWLHFLALALLMNRLFQRNGHWLRMALPRWIAGLGQHALPMFVFGACLSCAGGMALDVAGRDALAAAAVNLAGLGLLLLAARAWAWLDAKPWRTEAGHWVRTAAPEALSRRPLAPAGAALALVLLMPLAASPWLLVGDNLAGDAAFADVAVPDTTLGDTPADPSGPGDTPESAPPPVIFPGGGT